MECQQARTECTVYIIWQCGITWYNFKAIWGEWGKNHSKRLNVKQQKGTLQ